MTTKPPKLEIHIPTRTAADLLGINEIELGILEAHGVLSSRSQSGTLDLVRLVSEYIAHLRRAAPVLHCAEGEPDLELGRPIALPVSEDPVYFVPLYEGDKLEASSLKLAQRAIGDDDE